MKKKLQTNFQNRQYMLSKHFELFYYDDTNFNSVIKHSHDYYEFYFFVAGDTTFQIDKNQHHVQFGDMMLIPPHTKHRIISHNEKIPYRRYIFWLSIDFYNYLAKSSSCFKYIVEYVHEHQQFLFHLDEISFNTLQTKMIRLLEEMRSDRFGKEIQLQLYVNDLVLHINRFVYEQIESKSKSNNNTLYYNLIEYIETNLTNELTLESIAEHFYVSKYHIAHIFKENIGISIHQYITKKRLSLCQQAMESNLNITDIYQTYGFGDYSSFYRAFKKEFGISPKEYKNNCVSCRNK